MGLFNKKVKCKRFYKVQTRTIDIAGLKTGVPGKFDLGLGSFKLDTKYYEVSEQLQKLDMLQYGLCNDINGISDPTQKNKLLQKIIETKTKMMEIVLQMQNNLEAKSTANKISVNVSVLNIANKDPFSDNEKQLNYVVENLDNVIHIKRNLGYLTKFEEGGPIKELFFHYMPFDWDFPNLDLKIVNNGDQTIFLSEAVFQIKESIIDPYPLLVIKADRQGRNSMHFMIINEGWGKVEALKINFNINKSDEENLTINSPFENEIKIEDFLEDVNVNVTDALKKSGVDLTPLINLDKGLKNTRSENNKIIFEYEDGRTTSMEDEKYNDLSKQCLGKFQDNKAIIIGELNFTGITISGERKSHTVKFQTTVYIFDANRYGLIAPPSFQYITKFLDEAKDYERRVPISHVLKPKEADRFNIKIGMDKSSHHSFKIKLIYNEGLEFETQDIILTSFIPRSGIRFFRGKSSAKQLPEKLFIDNPFNIPIHDQKDKNNCTSYAFSTTLEHYLSDYFRERTLIDVDDLWEKQLKYGTATEEGGDTIEGVMKIADEYGVLFRTDSGKKGLYRSTKGFEML